MNLEDRLKDVMTWNNTEYFGAAVMAYAELEKAKAIALLAQEVRTLVKYLVENK